MIPEAIHANVAVLTAAKSRGIPVFAITNFAADTFAEAQARFPFLSQFDGIVVSAAERLLKPDPAIFTLFLSRYDLRAEACLFMDDSAANIAAADALGFCTILVKPDTDLRKEVIRQGFTL
jgi:HAD superfamily hydrolase (TIGR01509 family)